MVTLEALHCSMPYIVVIDEQPIFSMFEVGGNKGDGMGYAISLCS